MIDESVTPPAPGIYEGVPDADYRRSDGYGSSAIKGFTRSAEHGKQLLDTPFKASRPMEIGSCFDQGLLCHDAPKIHVVMPDEIATATGKGSLIAKREWAKENADGKIVLKQAEADHIDAMLDKVLSHPEAREILLKNAAYQVSGWAVDEKTGILKKGRADVQPTAGEYEWFLVDVKKTVNASPHKFRRQVYDLGYHIQAAYYLSIWTQNNSDRTRWAWVAVEDTPPYGVGVYECSPEMLRQGEIDYRECLAKLSHGLKHDDWPGYSNLLQQLKPERWMISDEAWG
jgi:hypothetical protein